ncbi:MAG: hypothetical protein WD823_02860 [Sulfuricaulis sp.]|uniref:hypothetical protein n=1 Tax=Sulfuricaulis sp. TaxID=2003553 RepID=UPI0034A398A2
MTPIDIVQKLWNYCNVLRDAGPEFCCGPMLSVGWQGFDYQYRMTRQHPLRGRIPTSWGPCSARRVASIFYCDYPGSSPGQADNEAAPAHPCARGIRTSLFSTATYLLFLKMADERTRQLLLRCSRPLFPTRLYLLHPCSRTSRHPWWSQAPYLLARGAQASNQKSPVPKDYSWPSALTPAIPAGAHKNHMRPFGGEKVHRTFSCFRLTSQRERENSYDGDKLFDHYRRLLGGNL